MRLPSLPSKLAMFHPSYRLHATFLVFLAVLAFVRPSMSDDGTTRAEISDFIGEPSDDRNIGVRFVSDELDPVFWLTQTQPEAEPTPERRPTRSRSQLVAARRRRSTDRLPSMFGDFYGAAVCWQRPPSRPVQTRSFSPLAVGPSAVSRSVRITARFPATGSSSITTSSMT